MSESNDWLKRRTERIRQMIQGLEHPYKELSQWEEDFLASVSEQFQDRGTLTEKQYGVLERIYEAKA